MADRRPATRRPNAIVASAEILTASKIDRVPQPDQWAEESWAFYDAVGEVRQATGWLGNAMGRCRLMAARKGRGGDEPSPIIPPDPEDPEATPLSAAEATAADLIERLAGGTQGQSQMLADFTTPLSVPGEAYLVGEPSGPASPEDGGETPVAGELARLRPDGRVPREGPETWQVFAADVLGVTAEGPEERRFTLRMGEGTGNVRILSRDAVVARVWRPHKRWHWLPDSPMRAVLGPLRRLALFGDHLEASGVSRLAGAGLLVLPQEMVFAASEKNKNKADPFVADLIDTMTIPIRNRDNASAVVPMVIKVKGDLIEKIRHITFATPLDAAIDGLIDKELRRFATGMDLPAEIVLGLADANHWTAWQIEESALKLHVEPMLEAICAGITAGFFRPALEAAGVAPDEVDDLIVWYDASELTVRPDRSGDAKDAYEAKVIGARAYRREIGMDEDDAPTEEELTRAILLEVVQGAPTLAPIILPALGLNVDFPDEEVLPSPGSGGTAPGGGGEAPADGPPGTRDDPPPPPDEASAGASGRWTADAAVEAALLASADALVVRALERAGTRLVNAARRGGVEHRGGRADVVHTTLPEELRASCLADADLLQGAWDRVPELAARYGVDPLPMIDTLDAYTRSLLASGWPHEWDRLREVLGG